MSRITRHVSVWESIVLFFLLAWLLFKKFMDWIKEPVDEYEEIFDAFASPSLETLHEQDILPNLQVGALSLDPHRNRASSLWIPPSPKLLNLLQLQVKIVSYLFNFLMHRLKRRYYPN
jgi:hypothetical protein